MADLNVNILSRFTKLPDRNQATILFVGVKGVGKHRLARSLLSIHADFSVQIRVATSLPLPEDSENTRPRIDFIVLFIDLTNALSLETIRSSVKYLDIDYFLGHCCFVVTQGFVGGGESTKFYHSDESWVFIQAKNEAMHAVSIQEVTSLADSYDSPLICADIKKEEDRKFLSRQLLHLLQVSCGFSADVTTLLLDTTRKSFVFEDELNDTME